MVFLQEMTIIFSLAKIIFTRLIAALFSYFYIAVFRQCIFYGFYWHAPVILDQTYHQTKTTNYVQTALTIETSGILQRVIIALSDNFSRNTCEFVAYIHACEFVAQIHACDFKQIANECMCTCFVHFQMNSKHILNF